ncbi:MAG: hypothetical protein O3C38_05510 [Proteobacteria bacterium]|nr:hypothetical protein [Pseudomonadota bacterium]MDA1037822.1 hypothetical protein [Pseudomonadota bacterium]
MKKPLALLLLFGIVGCTSPGFYTDPKSADDYFPIALSNAASGKHFNGLSASEVHSKRVNILIEFYSRPHLCHDFWKTRCLKSELKLRNLVESYNKENNLIIENQELSIQRESWNNEYSQFANIAKKQKEEADKYHLEQMALLKVKALEVKKSKCREYGFKDNTDGMGLCLIELDKLDAIKNQATAANLAQSNLIAQQQAEAKKQREAQALINLGALIGGAGVQSPTKPKPITPSYSESYTSSRTVPSNQNCPLLNVPLKKQEVINGNRICYY